MNRLCTCGHTFRIHGRRWIPDGNCRAYNNLDGPCPCEDYTDQQHEREAQ